MGNAITPGSFVEYVGPSCSAAGLYKTAYSEGTLRDKLFDRGSRLPETHRAARYRHVTEETTR